MNAFQILWKKSKFISILNIIYFIVAIYFLVAINNLPDLALKLGAAGLAAVLLTNGSNEYQHAIDSEKIDRLSSRLDQISQSINSLSKNKRRNIAKSSH